jgi:hypothetical protein
MMNRRSLLHRALAAAPLAVFGSVASVAAITSPAPPAGDPADDDDGILIDRPFSAVYLVDGVNFVRYTIAPVGHPDAPEQRGTHVVMGDLRIQHEAVPRWDVLSDQRHGRQPWPIEVRHHGDRAFIDRRWAPGDMARCRLCRHCTPAAGIGPDWCFSYAEVNKTLSTEEARVWSGQFEAPYPLHGEMA